jgi:predicted Zn-dependent peptidase
MMYENLRLAPDDELYRRGILNEIDRLSQKAAQFAIPNEFDLMIEEMGGSSLNAYTSFENIVYYNSFPAASMDRWLELYAHRFEHPVFRLFQSELETVYEEKNMSMDNPFNMLFEEVYSKFYPNSVYGKQTILGSVEHLKNPSLVQMGTYYKQNYVANNMALILTGNFDANDVRTKIEERFGRWREEPLPELKASQEDAFEGREYHSGRITPIPIGVLGYRTVHRTHEDALVLDVINELLTNSQSTGLLDQLVKDNQLMMAQCMADPHLDIGGSFILYLPKPVKQSLKSGEKLIIGQLEKLKRGEFTDDLLKAVLSTMVKNRMKQLESSEGRLNNMIDVYMEDRPWEQYLIEIESLRAIEKATIIQIAQKYFTSNYLAYHSKVGFPKKTHLEKPNFTPINYVEKEGRVSNYAEQLRRIDVRDATPRFVDMHSVCRKIDLKHNLHLYHTPNTVNNIFTMDLKIGMGTYETPVLDQVVEYMNKVGPEGESFDNYRLRLQTLGATYYFYVNKSYLYLHIEGFDEHYNQILEQITRLLQNPAIDEKSLKSMVQMRRMENLLPKRDLNTRANILREYAMYGEKSSYQTRLSYKEVKKLKCEDLIEALHNAMNFETSIHYVGTLSPRKVASGVEALYESKSMLVKTNSPVFIPMQKQNENVVYLQLDKKAVQSHIYFGVAGGRIGAGERVGAVAFNEYFGGSMNSIVFQEIREFRSLAYATWGYQRIPMSYIDASYFQGGLTTQGDKTIEAMYVYLDLLNNMPQKPHRVRSIRLGLMRSVTTAHPSFRDVSKVVENWHIMGYTEDPRIKRFKQYKDLHFDVIMSFYMDQIQSAPKTVALTGNKKKFDVDQLAQFGTVKKVKLKDIYKK